MIVYEVNLWVQAGVVDAYRAWLDEHVRGILALPGFTGATILDVVETSAGATGDAPPETATTGAPVRLCVHYRLRDETALADYLREHAPRLRADGLEKFGGKFTAERRVMRVSGEHGSRPCASRAIGQWT